MPAALIGLDMGSHTIKAVEVVPTREGVRLSRLAIAPTPPNTIINGTIVDPEPLGHAVADMLQAEGFTTRRVVSSLGGQTALVVRVTEVPRMPRGELKTAMKWDVERHIPFPATDIVMDFDIVEPKTVDPSSPNMEILLAVAQQELVMNHLKVLEIAKLEPLAIDIEQLASLRSLIEMGVSGAEPQGCVAIINIGASLTDISIIQDGWLRFPRAIPLAGETFTTAIGQSFVVEADEAESLKRQLATLALEEMPEQEAPKQPTPSAATIPYNIQAGEEVTISPVPLEEGETQAYSPIEHTVELEPPSEETVEPPAPAYVETVEGPVFRQPVVPAAGAEEPTGEIAEGPPAEKEPQFGMIPDVEPTIGEMGGVTGEEETVFGAPTIGMRLGEEYEPMVAPDLSDPERARHQMSSTLVPVVAELAAEIRRSIEYYRSRHEEADVERILLVGGSSKMEHMCDFIQRELGIPTELGNPFASLVADPERYTADYLSDIAPIMAVSVGLALREQVASAK